MAELIAFAGTSGLDALVETHSAAEVAAAVDAGAQVVGVNARDLDTLAIDRHRAWELLAMIPPSLAAVAESGMTGSDDVIAAARAGADAVLIGSALVAHGDPERRVQG